MTDAGTGRMGQSEVARLLAEDDESSLRQVQDYLDELSRSFTADEAFAVMTLVDTPDVFEGLEADAD